MRGHFVPGQQLTIRELAKAFGTSVMPVRDALTRLVAIQAVEMPSVRSFRIPLLSHTQFRDLCNFRIVVECYAIGLAAQRLQESEYQDIEDANRLVSKYFRAGNTERALEFNLEFSFAIYAACHTPIVMQVIEALWLQSGPYLVMRMRKMMADKTYQNQRSIGHHDLILKALKRRDSRAARAALKKEITETMLVYLASETFARPS
jgi:DNA-binding GntR family transcriptional regulator